MATPSSPSKPLRVLLTNGNLDQRAGSQLYIRDVARALLARGHQPIAFSTVLGDVANEMRLATIPVVDDLQSLAAAPDLIHGQHHLETMMALLRYPGVPALYVCHGWLPWEEAPPIFPRIRQYVAVDEASRDRLTWKHAIAPAQVRVLPNFVDLSRFQPRSPLPTRPRRALVFSNHTADLNTLPTIRAACARFGITLDVLGIRAGPVTDRPEQALLDYDLVFATGRSALEALAVGAAVIVCEVVGCGPLVTSANVASLRPLNFGLRAMRSPVTVAALASEIDRYDAVDAAAVSRIIRQVAGLDAAIDELLTLYRQVAAEVDQPTGPHAELAAAGDYLRWLSPRLKEYNHARAQAVHFEKVLTSWEQGWFGRGRRQLINWARPLLRLHSRLRAAWPGNR